MMGTWRRLRNDQCTCQTSARIRIHRKYQEFLLLLEDRADIPGRPTDVILTYKCPWCQRVMEFTHADILGAWDPDEAA
jgi:hypothetical protein